MTRGQFSQVPLKQAAQALQNKGQSVRVAAKSLGLAESTVRGHLHRASTDDARKRNKGRPRVIGKNSSRRLGVWVDAQPAGFTAEMARVNFFRNRECLDGTTVPALSTVQRALDLLPNVGKGVSRPRTQFTQDQKQRRLQYCLDNRDTDFNLAYFGDEICLGLRGAFPWQPRYYSTRKFPGGPPAIPVAPGVDIRKRKQPGRQKLNFWAVVSTKSWSGLVEYAGKLKGSVYRDRMLRETLWPLMIRDRRKRSGFYVHDEDKAHTANETTTLLEHLHITEKVLGPKCWLLNPIEHIWGIFVMELYDHGHKSYGNLDELRAAAVATWDRVKETHRGTVAKMVADLPRDMRRMIEAQGGFIDKV